ncbi:OsmC family protein [Metabacillus sp. RGM 3146]|uniref:OsmC family protein n=1 Tax=Metabacillus sp. RGM 3146 TaxID=3401092 RepID=UPI003B996585
MEFEMTEQGFKVPFDFGELEISGNEAYGFRPYQLMAASIAGCSGGVLRQILVKKKLEVEDIAISAEVTRNEAEANRIEKISLHYAIKGTNLEETKIKKAIDLVKRNCSMARSVEGSIEIEETFEIV